MKQPLMSSAPSIPRPALVEEPNPYLERAYALVRLRPSTALKVKGLALFRRDPTLSTDDAAFILQCSVDMASCLCLASFGIDDVSLPLIECLLAEASIPFPRSFEDALELVRHYGQLLADNPEPPPSKVGSVMMLGLHCDALKHPPRC
ncbi:MAG: hypothetical protein R3B72_51255 [Polyangiaceae bacterium]